MYLKVAFAIVMAVPPLCANADTITVRGGEHENFTRLVFSLPNKLDYEVDEYDGNLLLRVDAREEHELNTKEVFARITNRRIQSVGTIAKNTFRVSFNCKCQTNVFFEQPNMLVVDAYGQHTVNTKLLKNTELKFPNHYLGNIERPYITKSSKLLAESLLSKSHRRPNGNPPEKKDIPKEYLKKEIQKTTLDTIPNMRIKTPEKLAEKPEKTYECTNYELIDDELIDENQNYNMNQGKIIMNLYDQNGAINNEKVLDLAKIQIANALIPESIQTLKLYDGTNSKAQILEFIANTIEKNFSKGESKISKEMLNCDRTAAIIYMLTENSESITERAATEALTSMERLPRQLLKFLGPKITASLVKAGHKDKAKESLFLRQRALPESSLSITDIGISEETYESSLLRSRIAKAGGEQAAQAIADSIMNKILAGEEVGKKNIELVSSHVYEKRHGEQKDVLERVRILSLLSQTEFSKAFKELKSSKLLASDQENLINHIIKDVVNKATKATFLKFVHQIPASDHSMLTKKSKVMISQRLLDYGFNTLAAELMNEISEKRILRKGSKEASDPTDVSKNKPNAPNFAEARVEMPINFEMPEIGKTVKGVFIDTESAENEGAIDFGEEPAMNAMILPGKINSYRLIADSSSRNSKNIEKALRETELFDR